MSNHEIILHAQKPDAGRRLDAYIALRTLGLSRSRAAALISAGNVTVDDKPARPSTRIRGEEKVVVIVPEPESAEALPQEIPLEILYEDADLVAVNKPAGMVVHPGAGNPRGTLVNALLAHTKDLSGIGGVMRPGIVHRLDKGTSGVILVAKNDFTHKRLSDQFSGRTMAKFYLCITAGVPKIEQGLIDRAIGRHPVHRKKMTVDAPRGREARTQYHLMAKRGGLAAIWCRLLTGRTHQIRVHMKSIGCPILMDVTYGGQRDASRFPEEARAAVELIKRPALHAWKIIFDHPRTDLRISLTAPIPADLLPCLNYLGWK